MNEKHVVSLSGGKDSVAAALHLFEMGVGHDRVFMDTGWEHPSLYAHLDYLENELGPITRLQPEVPAIPAGYEERVYEIEAAMGVAFSAFVRLVVAKGMFPSRLRRFCTQQLKIYPFLKWVDALDEDIVNVVGIRHEESAARARMPERELMRGAEHIEVWRPLIRWTEQDVIDIHARHGVRPCPLYLAGSRRVGCWPCIQSNKAALKHLSADPRRVRAIRLLEALVEEVAANRAEEKGVKPGNPPTLFQQTMRQPDGTRPCRPIDDILAWANTKHGGRQMMLSPQWGEEAGCVRWGMCESAAEYQVD
tara:strand:+ start:286 stop:1206 length:921 start_codon:yes stop_codon:yes gene_type:complete